MQRNWNSCALLMGVQNTAAIKGSVEAPQKIKNRASPRSSNLTVGTSPKEVKTGSQRGVCTPVSWQHYSQQPRGGSNPCPLTDEWVKTIRSIHTTIGGK